MKDLYIYKEAVFTTAFTTVITRQYIPVTSELIDWRWEMTKGYWCDSPSYQEGYVPYVNGVKEDVYEHILVKSTGDMKFSSILADDNSYRLYDHLYSQFQLNEPIK